MPWLIEHNSQPMGRPDYIRVTFRNLNSSIVDHRIFLDIDPHAAMQFGRKQDAEAFIYLHPKECINCRPVEHEFISR